MQGKGQNEGESTNAADCELGYIDQCEIPPNEPPMVAHQSHVPQTGCEPMGAHRIPRHKRPMPPQK